MSLLHTMFLSLLVGVLTLCSSSTVVYAESATSTDHEWIQFKKTKDEAMFLFKSPARIERYGLATSQWLEPITLPTSLPSPTAFEVDDENMFVAYGNVAYRYNLQGENQTHMLNFLQDVKDFYTHGDVIIVTHGEEATSISRSKNKVLDTKDGLGEHLGGSISRKHQRVIGVKNPRWSRRNGFYLEYNESGIFTGYGTVAYDGLPSGHNSEVPLQTWMYPNEEKVMDETGNIYEVVDQMQHRGAIPNTKAVIDVDWLGTDVPIVLDHNNTLTAYSQALRPSASHQLTGMQSAKAKNIIVNPPNVLVFTTDSNSTTSNGVLVSSIPLASLKPPEPGKTIDPTGLAFKPDETFLIKNVLHLFSKQHESIFRWDTNLKTYLATIPLVGAPPLITYSKLSHTIYLAYESGLINKLNLGQEEPREEAFASLSSNPESLVAADPYVFASGYDTSKYDLFYYSFTSDGTLVEDPKVNRYGSRDVEKSFVWSEANNKIYFIDTYGSDTLASIQLHVNGCPCSGKTPGSLGEREESSSQSFSINGPVRVKPDGSIAVVGSGHFFNPSSLKRLPETLLNSVVDATFIDAGLRTARNIDEVVQFQEWKEPTMELGAVLQVPGTAVGLLSRDDGMLVGVVLDGDGIPTYYVMNDKLEVQDPIKVPVDESLSSKHETPPNRQLLRGGKMCS